MFQVGSRMTHNVLVVEKYMNAIDIQIRAAALSDNEVIVHLVREHAAGAGETSPISGNAFLDFFSILTRS